MLVLMGILVNSSLSRADLPPVRGLCITSPEKGHVTDLVLFMKAVIGLVNINTLALLIIQLTALLGKSRIKLKI